MLPMTPELARILHDERHRRFLAEAEARRLRRAHRASRRADRPEPRTSHRFTTLLRRRGGDDAKIARITNSWLNPDAAAALRLAAIADQIDVRPGTTLEPGRYAYIALDERHASLVVAAPSGPITLAFDATLLVLTVADLRDVSTSIPALAAACRPRTEQPGPAMHPEPEVEFDLDAA
jgi:hypothetical protein